MERNQLRGKKGFTLVEVMTAIAIIGFVIVSITTFMVVGSRTFASTSSEVNLQHESQLAYNQLQDLVIDTTLGITLSYVDAGGNMADDGVKVMDDGAIPASAAYKKLYMYNETVAYVVIWEEATSRLFYEEHDVTVDVSGNVISTSPRLTNARMADYITYFGIDLNRLEEKRIVRVDMGFEKSDKTYESSYNITLRNSVVVNQPLSVIGIPVPPVQAGSVDIDDIVVEPGTVYTYATVVLDEDGNRAANQNVRWTSENTGLVDTGIDVATGRLQISPYETATEFAVSVTSQDGLATDTATVHVRKVRKVTITEVEHTGDGAANNRYEVGDTITLKAEINDGILPDELTSGVSPRTTTEEFEKIDWDCILLQGAGAYLEKVSESDDATGGICVVKIVQSGTVDGTEIRVRANSTHSRGYGRNEDSIVYDEWYRTVYQEEPDFNIEIEPGDYLRGQEYVIINPKNISENNNKKYVLLYDFTLKKKNINSIGNETGYTVLERHWQEVPFWLESGNNCKMRLPIDMDPDKYQYDQFVLDIVAYAVSIPSLYDKGVRAICYNPADGYNINAPGVLVSETKSIEIKPINMYFGSEGQLVQFYAPRTFYTSNQEGSSVVYIPSGEILISNILRGDEFQINRDNVSWTAYKVDASNPKGLGEEYNIDPELIQIDYEGIQLKMTFNKEKWNNSLPPSIRYVPTIKVRNKNTRKIERYQLYKSYVDIMFYNIEVRGEKLEKLYFPYPGQDEFPGKTLSRGEYTTGTWFKAKDFLTPYQYKINCYETNGTMEYSLSIYENGGLSNPDRRIGVYKINEGETNWRISN